MKKVLAFFLAVLLLHIVKAQNSNDDKESNGKKEKLIKTDEDNRFSITYDYQSGMVNHTLPKGFRIKRIRPKVGSFISIKVLNLPDSFTVTGEAEFENGNIEGSGMFGNFFKPEPATNKDIPAEDKKPAPDSTSKKTEKILQERTEEINKKTRDSVLKKAEDFTSLLKTPQKLNIDNFETALETADLKTYLKSQPTKNDNRLKAAKEDYAWQQYLISIFKDNFEKQIKIRDSLIKTLSRSVDKEIQEKPLPAAKSSYDKSLTDIQVPNSDLVNLKITVKDKKGNTVSTLPLSYYNRAGYKIDFSTGFFHTSLEDQEYKAVNKLSASGPFTAIDTVYQIKRKEKGKGKIAIGVLAHYYPRWFKYFNIAASCGFSYQAENRIVNFLTGLSVLCGNQQRFIISGGASFGKVKELDTNFFEKGKDYHRTVLNDKTEIPVTERLKSSLFFGISYNLGTINNSKSIKRNF
jgi:hypothetical protein